MSKRSEFIETQWRWTRRIALLVPFWTLLIVGINIWHDAESGAPFNPLHLIYGGGMIAFAAFVRENYSDEGRRP